MEGKSSRIDSRCPLTEVLSLVKDAAMLICGDGCVGIPGMTGKWGETEVVTPLNGILTKVVQKAIKRGRMKQGERGSLRIRRVARAEAGY